MKPLLIYPMAFYVLYIFSLLIKMFLIRLKSLKKREIPYKFFKSYSGAEIPIDCIIHGRHVDNQFQTPMVFLVSCISGMIIIPHNIYFLGAAWIFVISRVIHSFIHLGGNDITKRALAYLLGWISLLFMWFLILVCEK